MSATSGAVSPHSGAPVTKRGLLILSFSPIASDARVLKQVELFTPDYEVTTCGYGPAPAGVVAHLEIDAQERAWKLEPRALLTRRYGRVYWSNRAVVAAGKLLTGRAFDVVFANDADTVPLALSLAPARGVHVDLHEYAPRQKEDLLRWRLFVAPYVRWLCRQVRGARSVTTVADGIAREYERKFGFRADVVTNASPAAVLEPQPVRAPIRLVHSGVALASRHLEIMCDALALTHADVTLDLFLMPNDPKYLATLQARAQSDPRIRVNAPLPYPELIRTLNTYDVGVFVLPPVNFNYAMALPNKFFDFVQARLGVIIGPSPEMARLVHAHDVGQVIGDFTAASLAAALDQLTPEKVTKWKQRSDAAAHELSAEHQTRIWQRAVADLSEH